MLQKFNLAYFKNINGVSAEVLNYLLNHDFPGNVRELLNLVEQSVIFCKGNEISLEHMPAWLTHGNNPDKAPRQRTSKSPTAEILSSLLSRHKGHRNEMARELGVDRSTLWRWAKSAGLNG
jgi:transcriptional regulator with PAS, ATPase and Fis domain